MGLHERRGEVFLMTGRDIYSFIENWPQYCLHLVSLHNTLQMCFWEGRSSGGIQKLLERQNSEKICHFFSDVQRINTNPTAAS